jgi:UDP-glucose 4,6-dehydratase
MILLIGASGYIGKEFVKQLSINNLKFISLSHKECKKDILFNIIKQNNIKYIINCAAFVGKPNIEACESQKDKCIEGNILLPILLKEVCENENIIYCHISTGCLYNGKSASSQGFKETDEPNFTFELNNCGFYTGTKSLAEKIIKKYSQSYIWRIRLPFEEEDNQRNYISKILKYDTLITEKNSVSNKKDIVNACIQSILKEIPFGIYHMTNSGSISALDIVEKIKKTIMPNKQANFITIDEFYEKISNMPRSNCVTDNSKILSTGIRIPDAEESIDYCLNNWRWK